MPDFCLLSGAGTSKTRVRKMSPRPRGTKPTLHQPCANPAPNQNQNQTKPKPKPNQTKTKPNPNQTNPNANPLTLQTLHLPSPRVSLDSCWGASSHASCAWQTAESQGFLQTELPSTTHMPPRVCGSCHLDCPACRVSSVQFSQSSVPPSHTRIGCGAQHACAGE